MKAACRARGATSRPTAGSSASESFYLTDSTVTGQTPGFTAALSGVRLGPLPIFGTVNAEAGRYDPDSAAFGRRTGFSLTKADITPSIRAPLSTLPYLQVNATASYRTTYYSESLAADQRTQIDEPVTRNYGDMRVDVIGPVVSRVFNPNNAMADRMKHVVEPRSRCSAARRFRTRIASRPRPATTSSSAASRK